MPVLLDETTPVLIQGITGREGLARARLMLDYGTRVVGGVTPGKGGQTALGLPVFNTVHEATTALGPIGISVLFVPAAGIKPAALEAIDAGVQLIVLVADRVPVWDAMEIAAAAKARGAKFLGPNTLGIASPGRAVVGMIGGRAESAREWFKPPLPGGTGIGVISRSGGMSSSTAYYCGQAGVRISSIVHIGGDAVLGLRIPDVARLMQADAATGAVVVFGEIGGSQEEELAEMIRAGEIAKPVIAYIGGKAARAGTRFSHAGAIIEGNTGTHAGKVAALRAAGATVADSFGDLPAAVVAALRPRNSRSLMSDAERRAVWTTGITKIEPNKVAVRGHDIASLMGTVSFGAAVYLILTGRLPSEKVARLMDAILVSSIDHGATPPSCLAARTVASTGASLSQSVAAGIMSINKHHGGAIEDCARYLGALIEKAKAAVESGQWEVDSGHQDKAASPRRPGRPVTILTESLLRQAEEARRRGHTHKRIAEDLGVNHEHLCRVLRRRQQQQQREGPPLRPGSHVHSPQYAAHFFAAIDAVAAEEVSRVKASGDRIPGFGHRIHTKDPRTARLFELAAEAGLGPSTQDTGHRTAEPTSHIAAARAVERAFAAIGRPLPINVDGAIGAILADLGLDPRAFNGVFMIARTPGLVAHVVEEQTRERPMRRIDPVNHAYDGPSGA